MATTNTCVWIGNLGMYNEGYLIGGWLELPVSEDELGKFLKDAVKINEYYMEYFFDDHESDLPIDLGSYLYDIYTLNKYIEEIEELTDYEYEALCAYLLSDLSTGDLEDDIEFIKTRNYIYDSNIKDCSDYAYDFLIDQLGRDTLRWLVNYIDLDELGKDLMNERNCEITPYGYFEIID